MSKLEEYRRKRRFDLTPEPSGKDVQATSENTFVVQKHAARRLHYDFRLAINGTLKSWAVPKGPSLNSADKRLAVETEDHPLDYGGFEGKIPEGSYGAGTVMVWDRGTFTVEGTLDARKQLEREEIKFNLNGEKLRGSFVLVKLRHSEKGNEWLMMKHKDAAEDSAWNIEEHDGSVLTGRTLEEIKEELPPKRKASPIRAAELQGARKCSMPSRVEPMLATLTDRPFSDPNWLFEIKWDGVRALARIENDALTLRSRTGVDMDKRYPELASLPDVLAARQTILDGEIVALDTTCGLPARASSRGSLSCTSSLIFSTVTDTTFAKLHSSIASSSCTDCFARPNSFGTPTISWSTEKNCSGWQNRMAWKGSSQSEPTARTLVIEVRTG